MDEIKNMKLSKEDFEFVQLDHDIKDEKFQGEAIGFFKDAMLRFRKNKASLGAAWVIAIIIFMAIFGPSMNEYTYRQQHVEWALLPPRVKGLEKIGMFDGTKVMEIKKESMEGKYQGAVVKIIDEYDKEYNGVKVPMVKAKINM